MQDLPLNLDVLVQLENNARHSGKQTRLYKLLFIRNKTCQIQISSGPKNFRITIVKSYLYKYPYIEILTLYDLNNSKSNLVKSAKQDTNNDNGDNIDAAELSYQNPTHTHKLPTRF